MFCSEVFVGGLAGAEVVGREDMKVLEFLSFSLGNRNVHGEKRMILGFQETIKAEDLEGKPGTGHF